MAVGNAKKRPTYEELIAEVERLGRFEKKVVEWTQTLKPIFDEIESALNDLSERVNARGSNTPRVQMRLVPFISFEKRPDGSNIRPIEQN